MLDFATYLLFPDQTFVIFLHRWIHVHLWYLTYPLCVLHTCVWVLLKVWFFWKCTVTVQRRAERRKALDLACPHAVGMKAQLFQRTQRRAILMAHRAYASAKRTAHGKVVNGYSLFWIALTPLIQKVGDVIVGIRWEQFRWRGVLALCAGASIQTAFFCLLYSVYGKVRAEHLMFWIMFPLGVIMLLMWLFRNGRTKPA